MREMSMLLSDKTAVIYGAGGAIGGAVARAFARQGARVFLSGRNLAKSSKPHDRNRRQPEWRFDCRLASRTSLGVSTRTLEVR
jgi:NAD(P)-dependent dehydrogenase (short-subunit alcohol dehydrogenase family)